MIDPEKTLELAARLDILLADTHETLTVLQGSVWLGMFNDSIVSESIDTAKKKLSLPETAKKPYQEAIIKAIMPASDEDLAGEKKLKQLARGIETETDILDENDAATDVLPAAFCFVNQVHELLPDIAQDIKKLEDACTVRACRIMTKKSGAQSPADISSDIDPGELGKNVIQISILKEPEPDMIPAMVAATKVLPSTERKICYRLTEDDAITKRLEAVDSEIRPEVSCFVTIEILKNLERVFLDIAEEIAHELDGVHNQLAAIHSSFSETQPTSPGETEKPSSLTERCLAEAVIDPFCQFWPL